MTYFNLRTRILRWSECEIGVVIFVVLVRFLILHEIGRYNNILDNGLNLTTLSIFQ